MSLIGNFRNARIFVDGFELTADHNFVEVDISAELLDNTVFGATTRTHTGGLSVANIMAKGFWDGAAGRVDTVFFGITGVDGKIISVFANGITEGTLTDMGFAFQGVLDKYNLSGNVGSLLAFDAEIVGRGTEINS